jgi:hypothetical protein
MLKENPPLDVMIPYSGRFKVEDLMVIIGILLRRYCKWGKKLKYLMRSGGLTGGKLRCFCSYQNDELPHFTLTDFGPLNLDFSVLFPQL